MRIHSPGITELNYYRPGEGLVGIVVSLLNEPELLALALVEAGLDAVGLFQSLQGENEQLGVVLVGEGREGYGGEAARLEPMDGGGVDGHGLLGGDVGTVLQVVVLPLLLRLQVQPGGDRIISCSLAFVWHLYIDLNFPHLAFENCWIRIPKLPIRKIDMVRFATPALQITRDQTQTLV